MSNKYQDWSTEELHREQELIFQVLRKRGKEAERQKHLGLNYNGITVKDIAVTYGNEGGDGEWFSFFVKHDGKLYDIYYDHGGYAPKPTKENNYGFHSWWPVRPDAEDDWDANGAFDFIPPGFGEACENCYEFHGSLEEALEVLKSHGITDIEKRKE